MLFTPVKAPWSGPGARPAVSPEPTNPEESTAASHYRKAEMAGRLSQSRTSAGGMTVSRGAKASPRPLPTTDKGRARLAEQALRIRLGLPSGDTKLGPGPRIASPRSGHARPMPPASTPPSAEVSHIAPRPPSTPHPDDLRLLASAPALRASPLAPASPQHSPLRASPSSTPPRSPASSGAKGAGEEVTLSDFPDYKSVRPGSPHTALGARVDIVLPRKLLPARIVARLPDDRIPNAVLLHVTDDADVRQLNAVAKKQQDAETSRQRLGASLEDRSSASVRPFGQTLDKLGAATAREASAMGINKTSHLFVVDLTQFTVKVGLNVEVTRTPSPKRPLLSPASGGSGLLKAMGALFRRASPSVSAPVTPGTLADHKQAQRKLDFDLSEFTERRDESSTEDRSPRLGHVSASSLDRKESSKASDEPPGLEPYDDGDVSTPAPALTGSPDALDPPAVDDSRRSIHPLRQSAELHWGEPLTEKNIERQLDSKAAWVQSGELIDLGKKRVNAVFLQALPREVGAPPMILVCAKDRSAATAIELLRTGGSEKPTGSSSPTRGKPAVQAWSGKVQDLPGNLQAIVKGAKAQNLYTVNIRDLHVTYGAQPGVEAD